jgi:hypothetical protein
MRPHLIAWIDSFLPHGVASAIAPCLGPNSPPLLRCADNAKRAEVAELARSNQRRFARSVVPDSAESQEVAR